MGLKEPLVDSDKADQHVLFDTVNSYYAGLVRMAFAEKDIHYTSHYVDMQKTEQLEPWYMRINPAGQIPALRTASGEIVNESRCIVNWAYGTPESPSEKELLDQLYSECPGSFAWLSGEKTIPLLKVMVKSPLMKLVLPRTIHKYQAKNPDLHDIYEKKLAAMSEKHFSKGLPDVQRKIQSVLDWLEQKRNESGGPWLLGTEFGRADAVACAYLQWIVQTNKNGPAPTVSPEGLLDYLQSAKSRPSFQQAIGQYGDDAFVLTMIKKKNRMAACFLGSLVILIVGCLVYKTYFAA